MRLAKFVFIYILMHCLFIIPIHASDTEIPSKKKVTGLSVPLGRDVDIIDVNKVSCYFYNEGSFGYNPTSGENGFYFPSGQDSLSVLYAAGLWVLGKVDVDTLRMLYSCVSRYASEFQPGMMVTDSTVDDPANAIYKVYKYNQGDDIDQDAIDQGCPDEVLGDQMLFSVYNDFQSKFYIWSSPNIGLEVRQTTFAYDEVGGLGRTLFSRYRLFNKGKTSLDSAYVAIWLDPDVGMANDDYAGCDTTRDLVFAFNGDELDEKYGDRAPAVGCDLLQGPIVDAEGETAVLPDGRELTDKKILGMTASFPYYQSAIPGLSNPNSATEAYYYVQGLMANGEPWYDPYLGTPSSFPFSGDPVAGTGWLMDLYGEPTDVKMGIAAGPFTMAPGDSQDVVIALMAGQGTDHLDAIRVLKQYDLDAQLTYESNFNVVADVENIAYIPEKTTLSQNYPNPFNPSTRIAFSLAKPGLVTLNVYNLLGKRVATLIQGRLPAGPHEAEWVPEGLSSGIYLCRLTAGETVFTRKLLFQK